MWETSYAREPINYKLFFLKLLKKLWLLPITIVIFSILVGGIYCFVNFGVKDGYKYRARTIYHVTFDSDGADEEYAYYNYYTWKELIHTDYFTDALEKEFAGRLTREEIISDTYATIESDYRYLYTKTTTGDPNLSIEVENALSKLICEFPLGKKEVAAIEVVDAADEGDIEDISLIFVKRAFIFGAVIGCILFFAIAVFYACVDTSVYLPATLEKRYHIRTLGAVSMPEFADNCKYLLGDKKRVAFLELDESARPLTEEIVSKDEDVSLSVRSMRRLSKEALNTSYREVLTGNYDRDYYGFCDFLKEGFCDILREHDAVVVAVKAAAHNGKKVERVVEQLTRQDIDITAFLLTCEDEWLLRAYYGKKG